jgi:hypothetical protein
MRRKINICVGNAMQIKATERDEHIALLNAGNHEYTYGIWVRQISEGSFARVMSHLTLKLEPPDIDFFFRREAVARLNMYGKADLSSVVWRDCYACPRVYGFCLPQFTTLHSPSSISAIATDEVTVWLPEQQWSNAQQWSKVVPFWLDKAIISQLQRSNGFTIEPFQLQVVVELMGVSVQVLLRFDPTKSYGAQQETFKWSRGFLAVTVDLERSELEGWIPSECCDWMIVDVSKRGRNFVERLGVSSWIELGETGEALIYVEFKPAKYAVVPLVTTHPSR